MSYEVKFRVLFGDVDKAGIAYYPKIYDYCHRCFEQWWEGYMQRPYHLVIQEDNLGLPAAHIEADFKAPMTYGSEICVQISISKIGNSSVVFRYQFMNETGDECLAVIDVTTVAVDMITFKPRQIPDHFRSKMEAAIPK